MYKQRIIHVLKVMIPMKERQMCLFPTVPAHRPSFFSYLSPQEFVDVSNQMYIEAV
ncbi:hypothetical protein D1872_165220 [compost metagenome]